jgi:hypothetical protein
LTFPGESLLFGFYDAGLKNGSDVLPN